MGRLNLLRYLPKIVCFAAFAGLLGCLTPVAIGADVDAGQADLSATFTKDVRTLDVNLRKLDVGSDAALGDEAIDGPNDVSAPSDTNEFSDVTAPGDVSPSSDVMSKGCGDGICSDGETCATCAIDCPADCPICSMFGAPLCPDSKQCYPNGKANLCSKPGVIAVAKPCKFYNDCVSNALCVGGKCRAVCDNSGKLAGFLCKSGVPCEKLVFAGTNGTPEPLGVCKPGDDCDTLTDVGCDAGASCVAYGWLKTCSKAGSSAVGAACTGLGQCQLGSICVDLGGGSKCLARCSTAGGAPYCAVGKCKSVLGPDGAAIPNAVGVCN